MKNILSKKISISIETKLNILIGFFLIIIFIGAAFILIENSEKALTERLISQAKSFSQLSIKPIIETYELYFDSGYFKGTSRGNINSNAVRAGNGYFEGKLRYWGGSGA